MAEKQLPHHACSVQPFPHIQTAADKLLLCSEAFVAFHDLFQPSNTTTDLLLSDPGREGLAHIFKLLADDALDSYLPFTEELEDLKRSKEKNAQ